MSWLKVDDKFPRHPKVQGLSDGAFRLHVAALGHCAEYETDGRVKTQSLDTLTKHRNKMALVRELCDAGLWESIVGGWEIHDYLKYNPSHADLEAKRQAARARMNGVRSQSVRANIPETSDERSAKFLGSRERAGLGEGSDPDPEGTGEGGARSETRFKSAPPVPMPKSGDHAIFEAKLRALPKLSDLDVRDLADQCVGKLLSGTAKAEWIMQALMDANNKSQRHELEHIRFQRTVGFINHAKRPKQEEQPPGEAKGGSAYREFKREQVPKFNPAEAARMAALISKAGKPMPSEDDEAAEARKAAGG